MPPRNARIAKGRPRVLRGRHLPDKTGSSGSRTKDTESTEVEQVGRHCAGASAVGGGSDPAVPVECGTTNGTKITKGGRAGCRAVTGQAQRACVMQPRDAERSDSWSASVPKVTRSGAVAARWTQSEQAAPCSRSSLRVASPWRHPAGVHGGQCAGVGAGPRRGRSASTPGLHDGTASRFVAGRRWAGEVRLGLEPDRCGSNYDGLARLFLDGNLHIEEPLVMPASQKRCHQAGLVLCVQSRSLPEKIKSMCG